MKPNGLPKQARLKHRSAIDALFKGGQRFSVFPLLTWHRYLPEGTDGLQAGFSCSKRHFKKAADRNRVKRLMREAYRLQAAGLREQVAETGGGLHLFFIYLDKQLPEYDAMYTAMGRALKQLKKKRHEPTS
ncbi:ribonuclease P protein component [Flaviaesturariibacter amylovorans]|uniref:Ribonuclease P protein component n=1 Tax=Flaviaesturariibacter amylovorans TaxID=1084520 RepID=A0ABP8GHZ7_9BACT